MNSLSERESPIHNTQEGGGGGGKSMKSSLKSEPHWAKHCSMLAQHESLAVMHVQFLIQFKGNEALENDDEQKCIY